MCLFHKMTLIENYGDGFCKYKCISCGDIFKNRYKLTTTQIDKMRVSTLKMFNEKWIKLAISPITLITLIAIFTIWYILVGYQL